MLPFRIAASLLLLCGPLPTLAAVGVTPVTSEVTRFGEAQLSIPILVPPGVGGVQPNLALSYRHRTLSTLLGRGWSIAGLSAPGCVRAATSCQSLTSLPLSVASSRRLMPQA